MARRQNRLRTCAVDYVNIDTHTLTLGDEACWTVYNVGGEAVATVDGVFSTPSLLPGIYIVKGVSADKRTVTVKIAVR